ncbi:MAG: glycosyltransferase WbuB [Chloroflexi bacterium]|nr:MAG: glycosyltransferase WbuB [Chloroflexota bacterium]
MMRVVLINRYFYPDHSATAQLLTELAEDLDARGERVTVITSRCTYLGYSTALAPRDRLKGIEIIRIATTRFGRGRTWGRLIDYLSFYLMTLWTTARLGKQDCLVVMSDPPLLSFLAAVSRWLTGTPTVCWLQDIYPDIAIRAGVLSEGMGAKVIRLIARWSLHRMDRTVELGRCMERHLLREGVPGHRIVTIPNWADTSLIQPVDRRDNPFVREQGLEDRFVVMYSGNLGVVHDVETLLAVIRESRSIPSIAFCFVGEGRHLRPLRETARRESWDHVRFVSYQSKELLRFSLSSAHLHLVTLRNDMLGLCVPSKIYGIMAAGRPMLYIGPEESEAASAIRESRSGFVVRPGDWQWAAEVIRMCHEDPTRCEQMGQAARDYARQYAHRTMATTQFWQVLREVAA